MRAFPVVCFALVLAVAAPAQKAGVKTATSATASIFGRNLLKNPNIEIPIDDPKKISGWKDADGLSQAKYGSVSGEWDWGLSGCGECGKQYMRLDFEGTVQERSTSQTVDVSAATDQIDKGKVTATPFGWLGGYHGADTTSTLELSFQDAAGKQLGTLATKPVDMNGLPKAESGDTGLVQCRTEGPVPAGTRKIVFTWHAKATGGSGSYLALGDNFSLVLNALP